MSNKKGTLAVLPPEQMDLDSIFEWIKNYATYSAKKCEEAAEYYKTLQEHHSNMASLMSRITELRQNGDSTNPEVQEELIAIKDTACEVVEAIVMMIESKHLDANAATDIEDLEQEILKDEVGQVAKKELDLEADSFLKNYLSHKSRLGLKTQQEVAELTGIDRRYISIIENGKHKPQFKTIKRIADSFGVNVSALIG